MANYFIPKRYAVVLNLFGVKKETDPDVLSEIEKELKERQHICGYQTYWSSENDAIEIVIEVVGVTRRQISEDMAEEIFEVANIVLTDFDSIHIEIKDVFEQNES